MLALVGRTVTVRPLRERAPFLLLERCRENEGAPLEYETFRIGNRCLSYPCTLLGVVFVRNYKPPRSLLAFSRCPITSPHPPPPSCRVHCQNVAPQVLFFRVVSHLRPRRSGAPSGVVPLPEEPDGDVTGGGHVVRLLRPLYTPLASVGQEAFLIIGVVIFASFHFAMMHFSYLVRALLLFLQTVEMWVHVLTCIVSVFSLWCGS